MDAIETQGLRMPKLGLGTFRLTGEDCARAVATALSIGYRHIDTAEMYKNEDGVGEGIRHAGIPRDDIYLTTKVWWDHLTPAAMDAALDASLARLGLPFVDLYLVHWPAAGMHLPTVMAGMTRLLESGRTRSIGVANFPAAMITEAAALAPIACNQVEYHVLLAQDRLLAAMRPLGIPLVAYAPLAQGRLAEHDSLRAIATRHNATPTQVALKWLLDQAGVAAIPKASRRESQQANLDALKLTLTDEDRAAIAALSKDSRFVRPAFAPAWDNAA